MVVDGFIPAYISQLNSALPLDQQLTLVYGPGSIRLSIAQSGTAVTVSWPLNSDGYALQQNDSLADPAGWSTYVGTVNNNNGVNSITQPLTTGSRFYRLFHQ